MSTQNRLAWVAPVVLLVALAFLGQVRYVEVARRSLSDGVIVYVQDRWTGWLWIRIYGGELGYRSGVLKGSVPESKVYLV